MELQTPRQDPRRLTFSPNPLSSFSNPPQSPYTPFSAGRPSATSRLSTTPRSQPFHGASIAPEPSEEAEAFISGGLRAELRSIALRAVSVARNTISSRTRHEVAINYTAQIVQELAGQLSLSQSLCNAPTVRPATRRHIAIAAGHLQLELDVWTLLRAAWTVPQPRATDLATRRLNLVPSDGIALLNLPGVPKVQHVLDWLEHRAADALHRAGGPLVNPLDDPAYRWAYTAARCGDEAISIDFPLRVPDDPLDEIERKAENRLAREVFRLVRAGQLEEAERLCRQAGQPWRAAALAGGKSAKAMSANGVHGAARRAWRKAAVALARSTSPAVPTHERAVCAVLAGVLQPLLAVCDTYDDQLWARLCVLLDDTVENMLVASHDVAIADDIILQTFQECRFASEGVASVNADVLLLIRRMQAYLALGSGLSDGHRMELVQTVMTLAKTAAQKKDEWACRLAAQVCLFLKYSGQLEDVDLPTEMLCDFDASVQSFVQLVIDSQVSSDDDPFRRGSFEERASVCAIAAHFLAEVDDMRGGVETYSKMMHAALRADLLQEAAETRRAKVVAQNVEERRVLCLQEAVQCFPSPVVSELLVLTVDSVWRDNFEIGFGDTALVSPADVSSRSVGNGIMDKEPEKDEMVIRAIEFLTFSGCPNYEEALVRTTCAARRFFMLQKRETARRLISWFPRDLLHEVSNETCGCFLREFQYWEVYFKAVSSYNDWHLNKTGNRPAQIPENVRRAAFVQPMQREARHKLQLYTQALRDYEQSCSEMQQVAVTALNEALLGDNGWMSEVANIVLTTSDGSAYVQEDDMERQEELEAVRRCGIPELVSLMHSVFDKSGLYGEAVHMATLVAMEEHKLFKNFGPAEMRSFLAKVAESAVKMADEEVKKNELEHPYENTFFEDFAVRANDRVTFADQ